MNSKNLTITAFLILSLLIGCSNPEDEFQKAKKENTVNAYESFINEYPANAKVDSARMLMRQLQQDSLYQKALAENTIKGYEDFLILFPNSEKTDSVQSRIRALRPAQGRWVGNDIQFNVSADGNSITKLKSKLENSCSIIISARAAGFRQTFFFYKDIKIEGDSAFSFLNNDPPSQPNNYLKIEGKFSNPSEASGTFTLKKYGNNQLTGSTKWKAHPKK